MDTRSSRLRAARIEAGFKSARSASLRFGWSPSTFAAHENGQNDFDGDQAVVYAKAFKTTPEWLYIGSGLDKSNFNQVIRLRGFIGQAGRVAVGPDDYNKFVSLPFIRIYDTVEAFEVITNDLHPIYGLGHLLLMMPDKKSKPADAGLYVDSVVSIDDQNSFLGNLRSGSQEKRYDLIRYGSKPLENLQPIQTWSLLTRVERPFWFQVGTGSVSLMTDDELKAFGKASPS